MFTAIITNLNYVFYYYYCCFSFYSILAGGKKIPVQIIYHFIIIF